VSFVIGRVITNYVSDSYQNICVTAHIICNHPVQYTLLSSPGSQNHKG